MTILALDLGRCNHQTHGTLLNPMTGEISHLKILTTLDQISNALDRHHPTQVAFEICPQAGRLSDLLRSRCIPFTVANTQDDAWAWRNRRSKTDRKDGDKLAKAALLNQLRGVHVPEPATRDQRALIGERDDLVGEQTRIKNSIRSLLEREWQTTPARSACWSQEGLKDLRQRCENQEKAWQRTLSRHLDRLEFVRLQIAAVTGELDGSPTHAEARNRLEDIPGIGPRTADALTAAIDDPNRFKNAKQVASYFGLAPRVLQSGETTRHGRITKAGPRIVRALLVECAWIARRHDPYFKALFERICRGSKTRRRIAIIAIARRLAIIAWAMMRDKTRYRPPEKTPSTKTAA
jgi:transposase